MTPERRKLRFALAGKQSDLLPDRFPSRGEKGCAIRRVAHRRRGDHLNVGNLHRRAEDLETPQGRQAPLATLSFGSRPVVTTPFPRPHMAFSLKIGVSERDKASYATRRTEFEPISTIATGGASSLAPIDRSHAGRHIRRRRGA